MKVNMDEMDYQITRLLEQNGRMTNTELGKKLNISETTVRKRIKRLIDNDLIKIVAVRNRTKLGSNTNGNIRIEAETRKVRMIADELSKMDNIWYIAQLAGDAEFDLEFSVASHYDLLLLLEKINKIDGVIRTRPSIRLKLVKQLGEFVTFTNPSITSTVKG